MESGHVSGTDINTHQSAASPSENSNHVSPDKGLRSSSHSSFSSASSAEVVQLGSNGTSSMPNSGRSNDGSATLIIPATHAMEVEQPAGGSPLATSDRIPSYVFAGTSATSPPEWSVASNESLFSIHMGNTSFSKDQLSWMSKSGELGYNSDSTNVSSPLIDLPSNQTPTRQSTEITKKSDNLKEEQVCVTEAMREALREKECQQKENIAKESSPHSRSISQHSDASVKSFAFPILTGDADKSVSFRKSTKNKKQLSQPSTTTKETPDIPPETPKPQAPQETPKPETPKSHTQKKSTRNAGLKRWFSCFSCCPSCS